MNENNKNDQQTLEQFYSVADYCRGLGYNILGEDRMNTDPKFLFQYDMIEWMNSGISSSLSTFNFSSDSILIFIFFKSNNNFWR